MKLYSTLVAFLAITAGQVAFAADLSIVHEDSPGATKIVLGNTVADIYVDKDDIQIVKIAAGLLADDVERVTGKKPRIVNDIKQLGKQAIIVGSIEHSALVDQLIEQKKIDVSDIRGQWETYKLQVVDHPTATIESALVIVGSDKRGAAYGVFTLSNAIGVSPWYWWADVTPIHRDALVVKPASVKDGPPSVKYRGIFINDEDWGLQPWAAKTFDTETKDIGPKTYEKVFELMLRLKMNYIWPAMHECTIEFGKIERNITLADEWGIVAGASHPEGMNRNNVDWPKLNKGEWRYDTNREMVKSFWEEWAQKRGPYEAIWTLGMRGVHDAPMIGPPDMASKVKLLEAAIDDQRDLLKKYVNPDISNVAQIFCPYKEALLQYRAGLKVPDDITLCWTEDNYGYIRQLSNPTEQRRTGSSGVYYHISYLGSPFSYVWLNTTPPALIWEEMSKAYAYGADRVWVLNVGDIKPGEIGIDFWSKLGWNINSYQLKNLPSFLPDWAGEVFGKDLAADIAGVMDRYYRMGFARKPESLKASTFSIDQFDEANMRLATYQQLMKDAEAIAPKISPERQNAYFELVLYPVKMAALTNEVFIAADMSKYYADKNDGLGNTYATATENAISQIDSETAHYNNELAIGKWKNIMTAKGTTSDRWGFRWPTVTHINGISPTAPPSFALPVAPAAPANPTFAQQDGWISIEAEHFTRRHDANGAGWQVIPGLGRSGDSMAVFPVTAPSADPEKLDGNAPKLEYDINVTSGSQAQITFYCLPTHRINDLRGLRYAVALDDEKPQVVDFNVNVEDRDWSGNVTRNASITKTTHPIAALGKHTLKVWMVDPGVVIDKIVMDMGNTPASYFGPPETIARTAQ